jgi:hypothetical protein
MNNDANLGDRELLDEDYLTIDRVPIVSGDGFVERTYALDGDLDDESGIGDENASDTRSMGGAVGTQHRHAG